MSKSIENAGYLFQLLLKYELSQETVSLRIIKILESYLVKIDGAFCSQLRAAFISEFLEKIIIGKSSKVPSDIKSCKIKTISIITYYLISHKKCNCSVLVDCVH